MSLWGAACSFHYNAQLDSSPPTKRCLCDSPLSVNPRKGFLGCLGCQSLERSGGLNTSFAAELDLSFSCDMATAVDRSISLLCHALDQPTTPHFSAILDGTANDEAFHTDVVSSWLKLAGETRCLLGPRPCHQATEQQVGPGLSPVTEYKHGDERAPQAHVESAQSPSPCRHKQGPAQRQPARHPRDNPGPSLALGNPATEHGQQHRNPILFLPSGAALP